MLRRDHTLQLIIVITSTNEIPREAHKSMSRFVTCKMTYSNFFLYFCKFLVGKKSIREYHPRGIYSNQHESKNRPNLEGLQSDKECVEVTGFDGFKSVLHYGLRLHAVMSNMIL